MTAPSIASLKPFRAALVAATAFALSGCLGFGASSVTGGVQTPPDFAPTAVIVASTRPPFRGGENLPASAENARFYQQIVTIPRGHRPGTISRPEWTRESPRRHFTLGERRPLSRDDFRTELARAVAGRPADDRDVLVYVHGFNTDYEEAAFRIAQVSRDAGFRGVQVLFTWPSYRRVLAYAADREVATASRDAFEKMLGDVAATPGVGRVHLLAHSMGAFLTMEGLRQAAIGQHGDFGGRLGEVILAAPDLDVEVFRAQVSRISRPSRISLFVQHDDRALAASSTVAWDRQRLGALDVRNPRHREIISSLGVRVFTMSATGWTDLVRHGTFAEAPEIVRLIGGKIGVPPVVAEAPTTAETPLPSAGDDQPAPSAAPPTDGPGQDG